jgi:hypothetical protein
MYLFKEGPIEDESDEEAEPAAKRGVDLGVGSLRPTEPAGKED